MKMRLSIPLVLLSLVLSACDEDPAGPSVFQPGNFTLVSVNAGGIPATFTSGANRVTVNSGSLVVGADSTFTLTTSGSSVAGTVTTPLPSGVSGKFTILGNSVRFTDPIVGTGVLLDGGRIRLHFLGGSFLFDPT